MVKEYDVLIVGAGPAGLAAGIVFGRNDLKTLICEQKSFPVDKACGEGIMPTGLAHLQNLGVRQLLRPGDFFSFSGICYYSPSGRRAIGKFPEGPGWGVRRTVLSDALLERARELKSLKICAGVQVNAFARQDGRICVDVSGEPVLTRLLVGADGLSSQVRRWAGLQGSSSTLRRWGVRQHYTITPWSDLVEIHWSEGSEAYITPCGENLIQVAFLWNRALTPHIQGGESLIPSLLSPFPRLQQLLKSAPSLGNPLAVGPLQRTATAPVADGVLLIGDAAGYLDAITGEGISLATAQALALENTVIPLLKAGGEEEVLLSQHVLLGYARAYQNIVRPCYQITRMVLFLSRHLGLVEGVVRVLDKWPGLFQYLLSAKMGLAWPWRIGAGTYYVKPTS